MYPLPLELPSLSCPYRLSQSASFGFLASYSKFQLALYLTKDRTYVSRLPYPPVPPRASPAVSAIMSCMSRLLCSSAVRIVRTIFLDSTYVHSVQFSRSVAFESL